MKKTQLSSNLLRILALAAALFILGAVDFTHLRLASGHTRAPLAFLGLALLDAAVLSLLAMRARASGWRLFAALFLVFFGVRRFLVAVEGYYLSDLLPASLAQSILINGALESALGVTLAMWIFGRWPAQAYPGAEMKARAWTAYLWRLPLAGLAYLVTFIAAGLAVFQPLAAALEPAAAPEYFAAFQPDDPNRVLIFQFLRGAVWALISLPLLRQLALPRWQAGLVLGLSFALLMGPLNLAPNSLLPGIRVAHAVEVMLGNFCFGLAAAWLLAPVFSPHTLPQPDLNPAGQGLPSAAGRR